MSQPKEVQTKPVNNKDIMMAGEFEEIEDEGEVMDITTLKYKNLYSYSQGNVGDDFITGPEIYEYVASLPYGTNERITGDILETNKTDGNGEITAHEKKILDEYYLQRTRILAPTMKR